MHALLPNYMKLDKRLSAAEAKVITIDLTKPGERSNAALIHKNRYVNPIMNWERLQSR